MNEVALDGKCRRPGCGGLHLGTRYCPYGDSPEAVKMRKRIEERHAERDRKAKADAARGKLVSVAFVFQYESGASRHVEFLRPDKIQGLLDDTTPLGDFLRDAAQQKGLP